MRYVLPASALLLLFVSPLAAAATDDFKVIKLEQDVRNLERQVQVLSRQLGELQQRLDRSGARSSFPAPAPAPETPGTPMAWLDVANWERLRAGMDELQVISALGPPTSMRREDDTRVLLYAMEIGSSGFLSGSVSLKDRSIVEIRKPVLR